MIRTKKTPLQIRAKATLRGSPPDLLFGFSFSLVCECSLDHTLLANELFFLLLVCLRAS